jgi:hypothetical protein
MRYWESPHLPGLVSPFALILDRSTINFSFAFNLPRGAAQGLGRPLSSTVESLEAGLQNHS